MREGEGNVEIEMLELLMEYLMKAIERLARPEAVRSPFRVVTQQELRAVPSFCTRTP
jgi:predicted AlkP superfamily phosphohydrolase/phosphomutase